MRTPSAKWLSTSVDFVSILLACVLVWRVLPSDYGGGGGAVAVLISTLALILRFVISFILGLMLERHGEHKEKGDHVA